METVTLLPLGLRLAARPVPQPVPVPHRYDPQQQINVTADGRPLFDRSTFPTSITPPGGTQTDRD